ncbi:chloride channel protein [Halobacteriovorax sp. ZH4_bin.1]|uniref:chloride channel protein n=1 Tax=unclassified Halobacteriovorax TaxID=2639665 RepID=UPI003718B43A
MAAEISNDSRNLKYYFSFIVLGVLTGIASSVFLHLLKLVTTLRFKYSYLIYFLPIAMVTVNFCYKKWSPISEKGNNLIIDEVHHPKRDIPLIMIPLILFSTLISHLFGASVGREGSAVQMGGAIGNYLAKLFNHSKRKRAVLLMAGCGAGFGSAIGAPFAGAIFGIEAIYLNARIKISTFLECLIASYIGFYTTHLLYAPHSTYIQITQLEFSWRLVLYALIAGAGFGLVARLFVLSIEKSKDKIKSFGRPLLITFLGCLILLFFYYALNDFYKQRYTGLGIEVIQQALVEIVSIKDFILKFILTAISLVSGIKGGEFTPLVYIGTTMGSWMSSIVSINPNFLAALGFCVVFGSASNTPLACIAMGAEIFGFELLPYLSIAMIIGQIVSGKETIYSAQIVKKFK